MRKEINLKYVKLFFLIFTPFIFIFVKYFGVNQFMGPTMFLFLMMFTLFVGGIVYAIVSLVKKQERSVKLKKVAFGIFYSILIFAFMKSSNYIQEMGLIRMFDNNELRLVADDLIANHKQNEYFNDNRFYVWPIFLIGPTRYSLVINDDILYVSFEGSPDDDEGLCYNPKGKEIIGNNKHLFGDWYRFHTYFPLTMTKQEIEEAKKESPGHPPY